MSNRFDSAVWVGVERRLEGVEAFIPDVPPWAQPADAVDRRAVIRPGSAFGAGDTTRRQARPRIALALVIIGVLLALIAALVISGGPDPDPVDQPFGPYGLYRGSDASANAAVLPDGRVLIVSGAWEGIGNAIARAYLWDPEIGTVETSPPITARVNPTATLLLDGRVLVIGGFGGPFAYPSTALASAEVWDPATGRFEAAGTMADARTGHAATLLRDGRVLVTGGMGPGGPVGSLELWDPATASFGPAGRSPDGGGSIAAAALLVDGNVAYQGGVWRPEYGNAVSGCCSLDGPRFLTMTRLLDGRVLVVQGTEASASIDIMFAFVAFDERPGPSSFRENLNQVRTRHAATLLADGRVMISGGVAKDGDVLDSVEHFDPALNKFVTGAPLKRPVADHSTFLLPDGRVLVVLDINTEAGFVEPFIYDPAVGP
jgi:Kelch motif protein/galactose oxidase-like protein